MELKDVVFGEFVVAQDTYGAEINQCYEPRLNVGQAYKVVAVASTGVHDTQPIAVYLSDDTPRWWVDPKYFTAQEITK